MTDYKASLAAERDRLQAVRHGEPPIRLCIDISPPLSFGARAVRVMMTIGSIMTIPVINHLALGGDWALDLLGGLFGFLVLVGMMREPHRRRRFSTPEAAAAWVASEEWRNAP